MATTSSDIGSFMEPAYQQMFREQYSQAQGHLQMQDQLLQERQMRELQARQMRELQARAYRAQSPYTWDDEPGVDIPKPKSDMDKAMEDAVKILKG